MLHAWKISVHFPENKKYLSKVTFNTNTVEISLLINLFQLDEMAMNFQNSPNFLVWKVFLFYLKCRSDLSKLSLWLQISYPYHSSPSVKHNVSVTALLEVFVFRHQHWNWRSVQQWYYKRGWYGQQDCSGNGLYSGMALRDWTETNKCLKGWVWALHWSYLNRKKTKKDVQDIAESLLSYFPCFVKNK